MRGPWSVVRGLVVSRSFVGGKDADAAEFGPRKIGDGPINRHPPAAGLFEAEQGFGLLLPVMSAKFLVIGAHVLDEGRLEFRVYERPHNANGARRVHAVAHA